MALADRTLFVGGLDWKSASIRGDDLYGGVSASAREWYNNTAVACAIATAPAPPMH